MIRRPLALAFVALAPLGLSPRAPAQCSPQEWDHLLAAPAGAGDRFAAAVAISGDHLVVGAPYRADGYVYVYRRDSSAAGWTLVKFLTSPVFGSNARFGSSVALEGDLLVVGAPQAGLSGGDGALYVHARNQGGPDLWGLVQHIPGSYKSQLGWSVDLHGDRLVAGGPNQFYAGNSGAGGVNFFERDPASGLWSPTESFFGTDDQESLGASVALTAGFAVAGGWNSRPRLYWIPPGKSAWEQRKVLPHSASSSGYGFTLGTSFLDIEDDVILIGSPAEKQQSGAVYVLERNYPTANAWGLKQRLDSSTPGAAFGFSVSLSNDLALVGSPHAWSTSQPSPAAHVHARDQGWSATSTLAPASGAGSDLFGFSVAMEGAIGVVGAPFDDDLGNESGSAYVFLPLQSQVTGLCASGISGLGCEAHMSASGTPSRSLSTGFELLVSGVDGKREGMIYWGRASGQTLQWGQGTSYQCVAPPVTRTGVQSSGGTSGACDGEYLLDFNAWMAASPGKAPLPGELVYVQAWYRDPLNTSGRKSVLTEGVQFAICP